VIILALNLLVHLLYAVLDPRVAAAACGSGRRRVPGRVA
jgi:hypothetical protein